ncbi:MAG TPA: hypothetical protein VGM76_15475, partial [Lacipirellulaceae bacterium]
MGSKSRVKLEDTAVRFTGVFVVCSISTMVLLPKARSDDSPASVAAADSTQPVELTANQDHHRLMQLLNIESVRPGRNGMNPQSQNYANYDESKANPFPSLPDPLVTKSGEKVTTPEQWWNVRRPEIVEDFDREVYGRVPAVTPKVNWEVTETTNETKFDIPVVTKKLVGHVDNSSYPAITVDIQLTLTTPAEAKGPVPVVMEFGFAGRRPGQGGPGATPPVGGAQQPTPTTSTAAGGSSSAASSGSSATATATAASSVNEVAAAAPARPVPNSPPAFGPPWQQQVLEKGWACATVVPVSVQADNGAGLTKGIIGLCNKGQPRAVDDWGVLRAWAWGASRAIDYFETDPAVDAKRVALEGHSRYGKATLVTMAYDPRLAVAFVSSSGEGGAKLHRRDWGEIVENIAGSGEYHWMAGNFIKYAGPLNWNDLPVDSHELIALCAPRPVFISAGTKENGDGWVDA